MPKPDPALLDPARYRFRCSVEPRFGDLDVNMHVTNVALIEMAQEGRLRFHQTGGHWNAMDGATTMLASFTMEFLGQAFYPGALDVHTALAAIGRTSQTVEQLITQGERVVGWTRAVVVHVKNDRPIELPAGFRESARDWMLRE